MLCIFTVGSLESFKSCLLFLVALPGLIDSLAQLLAWRSLLWFSMTWRRRYLTQSHFLSTTSLDWSLALYLLFCSVRRSLYGGRKEIHTHTHTHTHTHAHKPTLTYLVSIKTKNFKVFETNLTRKMFFGDILWILPVDTSEFSALLQSGLTWTLVLVKLRAVHCRATLY